MPEGPGAPFALWLRAMALELAPATPRRWQAATAALLAAASLTTSAPHRLEAQERDHQREEQQLERPEVTKLTLRGVHRVNADELRQGIATDASHCRNVLYRVLLICTISKSHFVYQRAYLDRGELARDVLRIKVFYFKRGYRETQVDTSVARTGRDQVAVAFNIAEGPPTLIESLTVTQRTPVLQRRRARRPLRLRPGDPLDLFKLDSTIARIRQALWNRGYADAVVDTAVEVNGEAHTARVAIRIDPKWRARVGEINILRDRASQHEVSDRTIRQSLSIGPGDLYVLDEVLRSQRSLYESNLFRLAAFSPARGDSVKTLDLTVREAPLRYVRASAGFNTVDYFQVDARFTRYNFLGGGRRLSLQAGVGNLFASALTKSPLFRDLRKDVGSFDLDPFLKPTWLANADFAQPWFNGPRNSLGLNLFAHRRATPGVVIDRGVGAQASFTRELAIRAPASLAYRYELTRVEAGDVYFCVNFGVCDPLNIGALRSRQSLSPISLSAQVDRTNDPMSPSGGTRARLDLEHASSYTASDYRYNRAFAEGSAYRRIGVLRGGVVAGRLRLGWVDALSSTGEALGFTGRSIEAAQASIIHPRKRFYAGGSQSVRGFGENQLGPRVLTLPPDQLAKIGCDISSPAGLAACNPNARRATARGDSVPILGDQEFTPRPLGGNTLLEANVEYRFPIWKQLGGAVFLDGALVGQGTLGEVASGTGAITPGFGVRYYSPVGPIRVDLGFNPYLSQDLTVVTEDTATKRIVELGQTRTYAPAKTEGSWYARALNRLELHFSIGQAF